MPEGAPRWILAWARGRSLTPEMMFAGLQQAALDQVQRAALIRFPPGAVIYCACGRDECSKWGVITGLSRRADQHGHLLVRVEEGPGEQAALHPENTGQRVVAFRGEITREVMRAMLAPEGEA